MLDGHAAFCTPVKNEVVERSGESGRRSRLWTNAGRSGEKKPQMTIKTLPAAGGKVKQTGGGKVRAAYFPAKGVLWGKLSCGNYIRIIIAQVARVFNRCT